MKNVKTYLIPTSIVGKNLVMEYELHMKKEDKRTKFYKYNHQHEIEAEIVNEIVTKYDLQTKANEYNGAMRVICQNGQVAKMAKKELEKYGFGK